VNQLGPDQTAPGWDAVTSGVGAGHRVLDVGAGTVALTVECARRGIDVLAIDFSPSMIGLTEMRRVLLSGVPDLRPPANPPVWLRLSDPVSFAARLCESGLRCVRVETLGRGSHQRSVGPESQSGFLAWFSLPV
jgi:SAM-dependent methyltransferase